jgi:polyhydroxyalkanoate synthesis repressor PhaR
MMVIIKRYPNRKLYDTEAKKYITLEGIADLIREGQEVQILDHTTGEDLTALTLTQIIFEQEKKQTGFLPRAVLTGLVQAGGDTLSTLRRTLASPLDMLNHVDEEIERRVHGLIKKGELAEEEGRRLIDKLLGGRSAAPPPLSEAELEQVLARHGVPTREDMRKLTEQLDVLASALETIQDEAGAQK